MRKAHWLPFVLAVSVLLSAMAAAQSDQPGEYEVKAAFLFNFTKFVEWPESSFHDAHSPIVIGIVGDDPFGAGLTSLVAGQKVQGRSIVITKYRRGDDLRRCHVLFVSASERQRAMEILAALQDSGVLTVSDLDGFAAAGGVLQFVMQENRVRFVVNLEAATQGKLRISAKLLALAQVVNHAEAVR